jgi:hypothetical protein
VNPFCILLVVPHIAHTRATFLLMWSMADAFGVCSLLPLMVCSIADAFGVCSLLPLKVCSMANAFGVCSLLPLKVCSIADAFGVCSLLPLKVCSIADAFGVCSLLPLKVCSIAKAFGVCSQLPLKVCSIADALGICSLLPLMVCSIADAFGVDILLPLMVNCIADACGVCFLLPSLLCICYLDRIWLCHDNLTIFTMILLQMLFSIHLQNAKDINYLGTTVLGGHRTRVMKYNDISAFMNDKTLTKCLDIESKDFHYIDYVAKDAMAQYSAECYLEVMLPMKKLIHFIPVVKGHQLAKLHGIPAGFHATVSQLKSLFDDHVACDICSTHVTIISVQPSSNQRKQMHKKECLAKKTDNEKQLIREQTQQRVAKHRYDKKDLDFDICDLASVFPPPPVDKTLSHKVIESACSKLKAESFEENGCAVCGQLVPISLLSRLSAVKNYLHILDAPGFTRQERHKASDKICEYPLAMDNSCRLICNPCRAALRLGNVPKMALARGLWLGQVPKVLSNLRHVEKMLVARICHSFCSVRVASGMRKMKAHAIAYQQPLPKVYNILPPPKADIEEVLAIMFTGPCKPTALDFQRTPFLVRWNEVKFALEWLILNHIDYADVSLSITNLNEYPEDIPPVGIEYKQMLHNKTPEGTSVHDMDDEDGTADGQCAFTVHGLTGEDLHIMSTNAVKVKALQHLNSQGKFLAIGHNREPESIWHNPQLYPQMFPWLFPYGLGGIGTINCLSDEERKKWLSMYHDKRFQTDHDFPFIAFSHEQIKTPSTQSFLLADKAIFNDIKLHILTLDKVF